MINKSRPPVIAFGGSAGGIKALRTLLNDLPKDLDLIMAGALHVSNDFIEGSASGIDPHGVMGQRGRGQTQARERSLIPRPSWLPLAYGGGPKLFFGR